MSNYHIETIDEKLKNYDIPMDVVTECVRLWNMMNEQIKKKTKGKKLFFFLTFEAYCNLGDPKPPEEIAEIFKISKSDYRKAYNVYNPLDTGLPINKTFFTPKNYLPYYCKKAKLPNKMLIKMLQFSNKLLSDHPSLLEKNPSTLSAGIFKYYCFSQSCLFEDSELKNITGLSKGTTEENSKLIMKIVSKR